MNPAEVEFLVRFICESDAIEGIVYDPALAKTHIKRRRTRGHVGAILRLGECADKKIPLTQEMVKQTQSLIVAEQHFKGEREVAKKYLGNWRDCDVWIGDKKGALPVYVPSLMFNLIKEAASWQETCASLSGMQKVAAIARFHYAYEDIHPFIDGNGRSGRALVYYLYRFAELEPFIFTAHDRHEKYYPCFSDPMAPLGMEEYFHNRTQLLPR